MSTITKEWLRSQISAIKTVGITDSNTLQAFEIALASLEAEPVACMGNGALYHSEEEARADARYILQPLYTAPPAPVTVPDYPETLPCPVMLEPGLRFGKGLKTHLVLEALKRRAEYYAELEAMTPEQRAEHETRIKECTAMLQGAK